MNSIFDSNPNHKQAIFLLAWEFRRECPFGMISMSTALKDAWAEYRSWKAMQADKEAFEKSRYRWEEINTIEAGMRKGSLLGRLKEHGKISSKFNAGPSTLALYPEDLKGLGHVFTRSGGIAPDEAATLLGLESTDELWEGLRAETCKTTNSIKLLRAA